MSMLQNPPKHIDVLMMEGTTIGRVGADAEFPSEEDLEKQFVDDIRETSGLYMAYMSAQNIDKMVTIFRAAKRTGRHLPMDLLRHDDFGSRWRRKSKNTSVFLAWR